MAAEEVAVAVAAAAEVEVYVTTAYLARLTTIRCKRQGKRTRASSYNRRCGPRVLGGWR